MADNLKCQEFALNLGFNEVLSRDREKEQGGGGGVCVRDRKGGGSGKQRSVWVEQSCFRYSVSLLGVPEWIHRGRLCWLTASLRCCINKGWLSQAMYSAPHVE